MRERSERYHLGQGNFLLFLRDPPAINGWPPPRPTRATVYQGARFPWESALDGTEQTPNPSVNTEGVFEIHSSIKLAKTIYHHEHDIAPAQFYDLSNGRVEFINTMVRLITGPNRSGPLKNVIAET